MNKTLRFNHTIKEVESKCNVLNFRDVFTKLMDDALSRPRPLWITAHSPKNSTTVDLEDAFGQVVSYSINTDGTIDILCDVLENKRNLGLADQDLKCELNGVMLLRNYARKHTEMMSILSLHLKSETTTATEQENSQLSEDEQIAIKMMTRYKQLKRESPHKPGPDTGWMLELLKVARGET